MFKYLIVIRHASALPKSHNLTDFERPLSNTGINEATSTSKLLVQAQYPKKNVYVYISKALRALTTGKILLNHLGLTNNYLITKDLYHASSDDLLARIWSSDDAYQTVIIVAHNPSVSLLISDLCSNDIHLSPAQCVILRSQAKYWNDIQVKTCEIITSISVKK